MNRDEAIDAVNLLLERTRGAISTALAAAAVKDDEAPGDYVEHVVTVLDEHLAELRKDLDHALDPSHPSDGRPLLSQSPDVIAGRIIRTLQPQGVVRVTYQLTSYLLNALNRAPRGG